MTEIRTRKKRRRRMNEYVYSWGNNPKRKTMRGRIFKLIARGNRNSALIEFENGQREIISRNAMRIKKNKLRGMQ